MGNFNAVKFDAKKSEFAKVLRKRVNKYFKDKNISKYSNLNMVLKTCNFGGNSKLLTWLVGGLNFQVEHHLFPNICHVHYKKISPIVKKTALEFDLPYHSFSTFLKALSCHTKHLKRLGVAN